MAGMKTFRPSEKALNVIELCSHRGACITDVINGALERFSDSTQNDQDSYLKVIADRKPAKKKPEDLDDDNEGGEE